MDAVMSIDRKEHLQQSLFLVGAVGYNGRPEFKGTESGYRAAMQEVEMW